MDLSFKNISRINNLKPKKGRLLLAEPFMEDNHFSRSVIYMCEHNKDGSYGFILNHKLKLQLSEIIPDFEIAEAKSIDLDRYLNCVDFELKAVFTAAVINHSITKEAKIELDKSNPDPIVLGDLMNQHHEQLQMNLKISLPKIEAMIEATLEAGACGAKIVGSGGGGYGVSVVQLPSRESLYGRHRLDVHWFYFVGTRH